MAKKAKRLVKRLDIMGKDGVNLQLPPDIEVHLDIIDIPRVFLKGGGKIKEIGNKKYLDYFERQKASIIAKHGPESEYLHMLLDEIAALKSETQRKIAELLKLFGNLQENVSKKKRRPKKT